MINKNKVQSQRILVNISQGFLHQKVSHASVLSFFLTPAIHFKLHLYNFYIYMSQLSMICPI